MERLVLAYVELVYIPEPPTTSYPAIFLSKAKNPAPTMYLLKCLQQQTKTYKQTTKPKTKLWYTYHSIHRLLLQVFHKGRVSYPLRKKCRKVIRWGYEEAEIALLTLEIAKCKPGEPSFHWCRPEPGSLSFFRDRKYGIFQPVYFIPCNFQWQTTYKYCLWFSNSLRRIPYLYLILKK